MSVRNIGMNIKGEFYGFQTEEVEHVLLSASEREITCGAEYCLVCENRTDCSSCQELPTVWLECSYFILSRAVFQKIAEDLHADNTEPSVIAS